MPIPASYDAASPPDHPYAREFIAHSRRKPSHTPTATTAAAANVTYYTSNRATERV